MTFCVWPNAGITSDADRCHVDQDSHLSPTAAVSSRTRLDRTQKTSALQRAFFLPETTLR